MLASLQERQPWLKPGAVGGPHRVSLEWYMVRCSHCLRQPCAHGPYVKLVIGRHRRGKRTRIHIPREIVAPVAAAVRRRQRITAGNKRAIAMLWGHYWQVRLYAPWRWIPTEKWWPTSPLARLNGLGGDERDLEVPNRVVAVPDPSMATTVEDNAEVSWELPPARRSGRA